MLEAGASLADMEAAWTPELEHFLVDRERVLIYPG
jgi:hypothetical protein